MLGLPVLCSSIETAISVYCTYRYERGRPSFTFLHRHDGLGFNHCRNLRDSPLRPPPVLMLIGVGHNHDLVGSRITHQLFPSRFYGYIRTHDRTAQSALSAVRSPSRHSGAMESSEMNPVFTRLESCAGTCATQLRVQVESTTRKTAPSAEQTTVAASFCSHHLDSRTIHGGLVERLFKLAHL